MKSNKESKRLLIADKGRRGYKNLNFMDVIYGSPSFEYRAPSGSRIHTT